MKNRYWSLALFVGLLALGAGPALAQTTEVTVVDPTVVQQAEDAIPVIFATGIFALLLRVAGPFAFMLKLARADQIIEKYAKGIIDDWLDHHPEWRTKGITLDVKKQWIAAIAAQVIAVAPSWIIKFLGGKEAILQKVRNRTPDIIKETFPDLFNTLYQTGVVAPQPTLTPVPRPPA